ncbi:DNRLRE domain-containing protein [Thermodesulfobacteriota bacterium]
MIKKLALLASVVALGVILFGCGDDAEEGIPQGEEEDPFSFVVTADMRQYTGPGLYNFPRYFRGVCEAIAGLGENSFMISPGDIDPPDDVKWTIEQYIGPDYIWYPVVGNHETETPSDMDWLRTYNANGDALPYIVNIGPPGCEETTFSFDYKNAHFAVINQYFDGTIDTGTNGDVVDALYTWLADDLSASDKEYVFVIGHEPAFPQPDADNGRARHIGDSLDQHTTNRDRFWDLLKDEEVVAYICGHTHDYSAVKIDGVWQLDVGHCRGAGDKGAPSMFAVISVDEDGVSFTAYRDNHDYPYDYDDIIHNVALASSSYRVDTFAFQDGLFPDPGYAGTRDTTIKSDDPDTNFGLSTQLEVDGQPQYAAILEWDISAIPVGSTVTYASITITITNNSGGSSYEFYEMKREWVEDEADWNNYSSGNNWQAAGADGADDRGQTAIGKAATDDEGRFIYNLNTVGIALVQSWVDDPSVNQGIIVLDYGNTNGLDFDSKEAGITGNRPKLTVEVRDESHDAVELSHF